MFDSSVGVAMVSTLTDPATPLIEQLGAAVKLRQLGEAAEAEVIAKLAEASRWSVDQFDADVTKRRLIHIDNDGLIDEALALEIACARGSAVGSATQLIHDVIHVQARHPLMWQAVLEARVPMWQAARISHTCLFLDTTQVSAIDAAIAPKLGQLGPGRLWRLLKATLLQIAPQAVLGDPRLQRPRYVDKYTCDDTASSWLSARLDTADAIYLDATIDRLADLLEAQNAPGDKDTRRAQALGLLATPAAALSILGVPTRRGLASDAVVARPSAQQVKRALPTAQIYVHLQADNLATCQGLARVEQIGPALISQLAQITGNASIRLTPVIHLGDNDPAVDAYEIPRHIHEHLTLRDRYEVFPYSSREARHQDLDHTRPYKPGKPGQTRPSNLGALSRRAHRAKTLCGWQLDQPQPGVFIWTTELGQRFQVDNSGTTRLPPTTNDP